MGGGLGGSCLLGVGNWGWEDECGVRVWELRVEV